MLRERIRKGVVLAAGRGSRMRPLALEKPKVLVPYQDKPLIYYPLRALALAGIGEIAVVTGHRGEAIAHALGNGRHLGVRLEYLHNPYYRGGNALSILAAREWLKGEPFLLCMGDHVMEGELVLRLFEGHAVVETLCVDREPRYCADIGEATKVQLDEQGFITAIGKELTRWDAVDAGLFLLTARFIQQAQELVLEVGMGLEISQVVTSLVASGPPFATCDVTGLFWADLDTPEDLYILEPGAEDWSIDTTAWSRGT